MVIPSALVEKIVDLTYTEKSTGEQTQGSLPRVDLATLLQLSGPRSAPAHGIVSQSEGAPIMLLVDAVLGQEDTVIKPFGSFLQGLPYFSGSSLAGDGTMRLVINPARMKRFALSPLQQALRRT
jgi:chemotaxis protein histidine kinase CheA